MTDRNINLESWARYAMKMECRSCGDELFSDEDDAHSAVDHALQMGAREPPELRDHYRDCIRCADVWTRDD
jgi:hypothetical protein